MSFQFCKFEVGSYSYDMSKIQFETKLNSVEIQNNKKHDYISQIDYLQQKDTIHFWSSTQANYSIAGFQITFHRHAIKYIIQYYVTSALFVFVSWVSKNIVYLCFCNSIKPYLFEKQFHKYSI